MVFTLRGCLMYSGDVVRVTQIITVARMDWLTEIVVITKRGRRAGMTAVFAFVQARWKTIIVC